MLVAAHRLPAGVPRSTATRLSGHKTEAVYRRYAIVDSAMLKEGVAKLADFHSAPAQATVVPISCTGTTVPLTAPIRRGRPSASPRYYPEIRPRLDCSLPWYTHPDQSSSACADC